MFLKKGSYTVKLNDHNGRFLLHLGDKIWIDRDIKPEVKEISFNIVKNGDYTAPIEFEILKIEPIKTINTIQLFDPERNRQRPFKIVYNPRLGESATPARIFTNLYPAKIEVGKRFYQYPPQVRMFILLHELGHLYYTTEHKCDLFALKNFIEMGFNISQAFYALSKVLHPNETNKERINQLFNEIKNNGLIKE